MIAAHVLARGHEPVNPTVRILKHWWHRLNLEVFANSLKPCQITYGLELAYGPVLGLCFALSDGRSRIHLQQSPEWTRSGMLSALVHEMVHQYQHQNDLPFNHGPGFRSWSQPINALTGLTI